MTGKKAKRWTAARKTELIIDVMAGKKSVAEACRESGIAQSTFFTWKKAFLEGGTAALKGKDRSSREAELEAQLKETQRKVGELLMDKEILEFAVKTSKKKGWS